MYLALGLNHLCHLRENLYLLSMVNSMLLALNATTLHDEKRYESTRDRAASLFLHIDQFIKGKKAFASTFVTTVVNLDPWQMIIT